MGNTKEECIRVTQKLVDRISHGDMQWLKSHTNGFQCRISVHNEFADITQEKIKEAVSVLSKNVTDVTHKEYCTILFYGNHAMVSGTFLTHHVESNGCYRECRYGVHSIFVSGRIIGLEIEPKALVGSTVVLQDIHKETQILWDSEIVYVEAMCSHLYWHSSLAKVETTGSLLQITKTLPSCFVRIHKSYLVNKKHVRGIRRCEVTMDNGDILQISPKKYKEVKMALTSSL